MWHPVCREGIAELHQRPCQLAVVVVVDSAGIGRPGGTVTLQTTPILSHPVVAILWPSWLWNPEPSHTRFEAGDPRGVVGFREDLSMSLPRRPRRLRQRFLGVLCDAFG
jgi:hypothetical protein